MREWYYACAVQTVYGYPFIIHVETRGEDMRGGDLRRV